MRRHSKAKFSRSDERKPSGQGSAPSGRLRLTVLLATVAAFMLVPAAQAVANGTMTVNIEGTGAGEVSSTEGFFGTYKGTPPLGCSYASPGPQTGTCVNEMSNEGEGFEAVMMYATPAPGSEFTGWLVEEGMILYQCKSGPFIYQECMVGVGEGEGNAAVSAVFECETEGGCEEGPEGPTNRASLSLTKSAGGSGGVGTVKSKAKGINCGSACSSADASFYKNSNVELSAKPALGSTFVEWTGACSGASPTCVVSMTEAKSVGAVFGGTSKAILSPTALSVSKGESTGYGTVKATGLYCEADCTATTVLYQGTITEPKPKEAKTVVLSQVPLYGSEFSGWSGCDSEAEGKCIVTMSEAKEVTAEYTLKPNVALTIEKGGTGTGTVSSKPKGVKCAVTCTTQDMAVPTGEAVILKAKAALGMTFTGWSGGGCSGAGETCTVNPTEATTVTATFSGSPKPILSPTALTLAKAGSGYGTVKTAGLTCEALCTSATSLFQGTITEPKPKEAKIVILLAISAPGSQAVAWSGCDSEPEGNCQVQMSSAKEVTATFNELP